MGRKTVYLDHAATSWPKPDAVCRAVQRCLKESGGNPGRGSHRLAAAAAEEIYNCRDLAGQLFDASPERVVCTAGATAGLNMALTGLLRRGDHVLISSMSHNAVYRPVYALAAEGEISFDIYDSTDCLASIRQLCTEKTRMIVSTHMSNICGHTEPVREIGAFCRERGILLVVDGAQSGGHVPVSVDGMGIDVLCLPGHKGLLGLQGCGLLVFGKDAPACRPMLLGGSGSHSLDPLMPEDLPEHLEAGTLPTPAIAGLTAGLAIVLRETPEALGKEAAALGNYFRAEAMHLPGIRFYGEAGGVVSFTLEGILPSAAAEGLDRRGICVRSGYHCAPLAHRSAGSFSTGTVRVSFGYGSTRRDADKLVDGLYGILREYR